MTTQSQQIENITLNTISMIKTLQATGEDMSIGFSIDHQSVLNVLDVIAENVMHLEQLNNGFGYDS